MAEATGTRCQKIAVTAPLGRAWAHMKEMLLPFNFNTWIALGLVAWLSTLGKAGFKFTYHTNLGKRGKAMPSLKDAAREATAFLKAHLETVLLIGAAAAVLGLALYVVFLYLRSRGVFMYLDAVYRKECRAGAAWRRAAAPAKSYFVWHLWLDGVNLIIMIVLAGAMAVVAWPHLKGTAWTPVSVALVAAGAAAFVLAAVGCAIAAAAPGTPHAPKAIQARIVACPHCGAQQQIPGGAPGTYACPSCHGEFEVQ